MSSSNLSVKKLIVVFLSTHYSKITRSPRIGKAKFPWNRFFLLPLLYTYTLNLSSFEYQKTAFLAILEFVNNASRSGCFEAKMPVLSEAEVRQMKHYLRVYFCVSFRAGVVDNFRTANFSYYFKIFICH